MRIVCCRVKDLKLYLTGRSVAMDHCTEKNDLVELVLKHNDSTEYFREQTEARRRADAMRVRVRLHVLSLSPWPANLHCANGDGSQTARYHWHNVKL